VNGRQPFGIIGVFETAVAAAEAARILREVGLHDIEAYAPYPAEELGDVLHPGRRIALPLVIFLGAVIGAGCGYFIQYWDEVINYPINVGGRPYNSWPAFIVSTFEIMLLFAIAAGFFGLWASCRLPRLCHPLFDALGFERATRDRFVLCVEARDPGFEAETVRRILQRHGAAEIAEVRE
jgi:hypothetical protein